MDRRELVIDGLIFVTMHFRNNRALLVETTGIPIGMTARASWPAINRATNVLIESLEKTLRGAVVWSEDVWTEDDVGLSRVARVKP